MPDEINYEAVAKQYQLENEILRNTMKGMVMGRSWSTVKAPDFSWFRNLSFTDRYYVVAGACMIVGTICYCYSLLRGD